ncbi:PREDICTED: phosphoinositide 3-kinase adapter protein 1 [Elephantulus edwardii]|uniref:phosphoinositide 3-kinase adapter protein 1 n=1 Tax=Elephantulus edwardii TaxID=28737 RepID=UPI0003F07371|nr:PREDICTED: phosphoinositide 3-kinase adapter protein 1 [Elephantulus edwardii]
MRRWFGQLALLPTSHPKSQKAGRSALSSSPFPKPVPPRAALRRLIRESHLAAPVVGRTWRKAALLCPPSDAGTAPPGPRGALTSPPQRPRVQVAAGPAAGRAVWTRPRGESRRPGRRKRHSGGRGCSELGARSFVELGGRDCAELRAQGCAELGGRDCAELGDRDFSGMLRVCDILIVYSPDAEDWCHYLQELFLSSRQVRTQKMLTHRLGPGVSFSAEDLSLFLSTRCIMVLLSGELVQHFYQPSMLPLLQRAFHPPQRMVRLLCGVQDSEEFLRFFPDWAHWQELTCDDEPEIYVAAVKKAVSEDSGCDSVTDTETEDEKVPPCPKQHNLPLENSPGNLMVVQPDRIRCGAETTVYIIVKCKLDERVTPEVEFSPEDSHSIRVEAKLENEYTVAVKAPNLSSGNVSLKVYCRDLVCETTISYYTDMEEIGNLLSSASNPVEFMCQAFKIVPYNTETLDKLLTESLKNNIPASGLHLFGISQLEEEDMMTNQRDEELPTLLHFAAKYGLKNLTALLLTCPGALQAYSVANKHGHYPNTIAEKHGFRDLRQFIDEYVETVDMLKSHIKEELMQGEEEADAVYESMAHLSTDLLMKCSLNPGCDEELYESMAAFAPATSEDLYVEMLQASTSSSISGDSFSRATKDSMIRKFLEGNTVGMAGLQRELCHLGENEDVYHTVVDDDSFSVDVANRPPVPVPRPEASPPGAHQRPDSEPYISKVFAEKSQERPGNLYISSESIRKEPAVRPWRDRPQSSVYDPFAGMKTPGQRQLITLQEQVKLGIVNVDEAVLHFKEWQLNQKKRSESFRFQQENLKRLRESITRRQREKQKCGKQTDLEITVPIRHSQNLPGKVEYGVYESGPRKSVFPPRTELRRGDWKTESTSSTASSASNRSSTRSLLSVSSGMEGDNEDNEVPEVTRSRSPGPLQVDGTPPVHLERPPRVPPRAASQRPPARDTFPPPPPVPPRGR